MEIFLTVQNRVLVATWQDHKRKNHRREFVNKADFNRFLNEFNRLGVDVRALCSSSVDFPAEYTNDPEVIALCEDLRNPKEME